MREISCDDMLGAAPDGGSDYVTVIKVDRQIDPMYQRLIPAHPCVPKMLAHRRLLLFEASGRIGVLPQNAALPFVNDLVGPTRPE